jgi:hypothetical protein
MLIGAGVGAITNPDDRLRGALLGGTLGSLTGGLGGAAAGTTTASGNALAGGLAKGAGASQAALTATMTPAQQAALATAAKGTAAKAAAGTAGSLAGAGGGAAAQTGSAIQGINAANAAAAQQANLINSVTSGATELGLGSTAPQAIPTVGQQVSAGATDLSNLAAQQNPTGINKFLSVVKDKPLETSLFAQSMLGGQEQPQQAPVYAAPIEQNFNASRPPSVEERLAMTGGNEPSFVPKGLFEEERLIMDDEERLKIMNQQFRSAGLV